MSGGGYPKFRNDRGVPEICIGVKEFKCIGVSPPQDHPHVYINMREADTILPKATTENHIITSAYPDLLRLHIGILDCSLQPIVLQRYRGENVSGGDAP